MTTEPLEPLVTAVARNVSERARAQGLTQAAIGQALGLSQPTVSHRLAGLQPFTLLDLERLSPILGVGPSVLMLRKTSTTGEGS